VREARVRPLRMRGLLVPYVAFRGTLKNADLRRVVFASAGFVASEWAYTVALAVYAYRAGGPTFVGLAGLIRMFPAAIAAPVGSLVLDTRPRERVLVVVYLLRAAMLIASAVALAAGAHVALVFALAALISLVSAMIRPVQWSLVPLLAETPEELAASNAALSLVEGLGILAAPAAAGLLLLTTSPSTVFLVSAVLVAISAIFGARTRTEFLTPRRRQAVTTVAAQVLDGFRALTAHPRPRLLTSLAGVQTFVRGALNVLVVVVAIDLVRIGAPGVGYLTAAFGAGGVIGATVAMTLTGRRKLAVPLAAGLVLWGAPIALLGLVPSPAAALLLLTLPGIGNAVFDLALFTLLQRRIPNQVLGRAFGAFEGVVMASVGIGSIVTPLLIHAVGVRASLVVIGLVLPTAVAVSWHLLRRMDREVSIPERELELLRSIPMFAPLPAVALEQLAARMRRVEMPAGSIVVREGDAGDRFYVLAEGACEVLRAGREIARPEVGDYFGEIALIRDRPRTATVRATTDAILYALDRDDFLVAVTGHSRTTLEADAVVDRRLEQAADVHVGTPEPGR
jgi:MFS family permease